MKTMLRLRIYKPALLIFTILLAVSAGFAQNKPKTPTPPKSDDYAVGFSMDDINLNLDLKNIDVKLNNPSPQISLAFSGFNKNLKLATISPCVKVELKGLENLNMDLNNIEPKINLDLNVPDQIQQDNNESRVKSIKYKSYSKSYPVDGNDRIKLSNQYGKITVNTWDKHEMKVDVQIKAEANDDDEAQKLLNGVQIRDSKEGDQISFRTSIEPNSNGSWKMWNWGNNRRRKLEINYTVYMPAKTDLNVEDSYGGIVLPKLDGRVKISSSYGSVTAENLSNPSNQIDGSYGNLKVGSLNGGHVSYSYGNVEINECNNIKGGLSYGAFKLGRLNGAADLDLSYIGGFKINEVGPGLKRLDINSTYSGISLGLPGNNSFDFDITTTYGGFNYNDDKVTITNKTPTDSRHYSSTKNYKGHFGKGAAGAQVNIRSTYGSVNFE
ncbi:MAG: hypothetical protein NVSMB24_11540 [Mucilaginibacter sp.]